MMRPRLPFTLLLLTLASNPATSLAQEGDPDKDEAADSIDYSERFRVFSGAGHEISLEGLVGALAGVEVAYVGESHDDPVGHWVEADIFRRTLERFGSTAEGGARRTVALSLEMFERDVQGVVDEYLADLVTEKQFLASSRPWEFYDSDYKPLMERAKMAGVSVIASNAPRRYVNRVTRLGPESLSVLSAEARGTLAPLPYPGASDAYRAEWDTLMSESMRPSSDTSEAALPVSGEPAPAHAGPGVEPPEEQSDSTATPVHTSMANAIHSQALWDATMAHSVTTYLLGNPGALVLHVVGGFHVQNHTGVPEKVSFYRPGTRSLVIMLVPTEDFTTFDLNEHGGLGDYVILTDASLRRSAEGG